MLLQVLSCEPYEGAGRVGWALTPGSRWLRLHRRSRRHFSARTALPSPPCGLFISPTGWPSARSDFFSIAAFSGRSRAPKPHLSSIVCRHDWRALRRARSRGSARPALVGRQHQGQELSAIAHLRDCHGRDRNQEGLHRETPSRAAVDHGRKSTLASAGRRTRNV